MGTHILRVPIPIRNTTSCIACSLPIYYCHVSPSHPLFILSVLTAINSETPLIGVTRLERAIPASQMPCGTSSATPRYLFNCGHVSGQICGQAQIWLLFDFYKLPEIRTVKGFSAVFIFGCCIEVPCSQTTRATNCATPRKDEFLFSNNEIFIFFIEIFFKTKCISQDIFYSFLTITPPPPLNIFSNPISF